VDAEDAGAGSGGALLADDDAPGLAEVVGLKNAVMPRPVIR
jgi:hypothetical protein